MNKNPSQKNKRTSFAKTQVRTPLPNLIETQKLAYDAFLKRDVPPTERSETGLQAVFKEVFPIYDFSEVNSLEFVSYSLGTPKYTLQECVARGVTYQVSLTARIMLVVREADSDADEPHVVDIRESDVYLGEVPLMTENGSFIVNGSERVIVSQLHRSPGVIFLEKSLPTGRRTPTAQIIPYRGAWVEFEIDTKDQIYVRIDKRRKLPATVLLRALGWDSDADILKLFAKTERLVLAGWRVIDVEGPVKQVKAGDLLDAADFRQASKDYPDLEVENCYRVTEVTDEDCPLEIGQEVTSKERTSLRRKWKGFETELFRRVIDTHDSACELAPEQLLTDSEYQEARSRYGRKAFTAEQIAQDAQESVGRVCAEDIIHPETGEVLLTANTLLTETELERLTEAGVEALTVLDAEDCQHIRFLRNTLERDRQADYEEPYTLQDAALLTIFRTLRPGDPAGIENARKHLAWLLFDAHRYDLGVVGRYKLNRKFHDIPIYGEPPEETFRTLRPEDIAATVDYLLKVHNGLVQKDDLDHLGNRRVRVIGELLENQFRMGLFQIRRTTRERLSTNNDIAKVVPSSLVNPKPLMMALREFFGSNQLSQFMQQINPLDELTHKRRISAIGPGGLHRDRATAAVRDVHPTHYGRVCPLETPEGPSIGLIVSLACYGRINPYGFIETPYHKVEEGSKVGSVEYLTADREDTAYIAAKAAPRAVSQAADGNSEQILPVRSGEDILSLPMEKVDYIGVSPQQIVGISAALVPFLEHEDANRALMGANHQRQAVPLISPEAPLVGTGMEAPAALYSGALITAARAGTVTSVSADEILIHTGEALHADKGENTFSEMGYDVYKLQTFKRSNSGTCIHQRPIVAVGDKVEAEQVIADGTSTEDGELALGRNILCAYMPWGGHNYEDSILISESLIKEDTFTSIHIEEFEVEARETKVGPEEITRDIPNVSEQRLTQLDEEGIIRVGSVVGAGSILVGKITPKGESEYGPEEKLLRAIFGEKVKEVRDASTYVRPGVEGVVIDVKVFSRKPDGASRRGNWSQGDANVSMADNLRYESKRKEVEETWRKQIASIRRRKTEEIHKTLIGCELANSLYTVNGVSGSPDAKPFANAGDTLTAEVLDAYVSGFTADEYHIVTEDTASEAFIAEACYKVTNVPDPVPTIVVHPLDSSTEEPITPDSDESENGEPGAGPTISLSETLSAVQVYLSKVCEPLIEDTEPLSQEEEPLNEEIADANVVLRGYNGNVVAIVLCADTDTGDEYIEGGPLSERLSEMLVATDARFGILVTGADSEPDNWHFYGLVGDTVLQPCDRSEFEIGVTAQLEAAGCPVVETQRLTQEEWENFSETYKDLEVELFWDIKEVFDPACSLIEGQEITDVDYQQVFKDFPARPIQAGQRLTPNELESLTKTTKHLKTDNIWHITAVFDPKCTLSVGDDVSDADYQEALKSCSLSVTDIHVTNADAKEHIQRVEEMAQGRITTYTEEKDRALQQLDMGDELKPGVIKRVKVYVASKRPISVGDKMAGRYGNKGVVAKILPVEDMPYLPDGTPVELVLNPLGVPSRMNVGQILEIHLGWACHELGIWAESPVFDGATEEEIFEMLGKTDLPERSKQTGKSILFDGRSGEPFAQEVTVGYVYFLKLNHLVADKMHARSTGPYSLVTQQPLGGKAQHGGQRLGEMEVWALEAYGAAHTLQEMLTLKSDDVLGRREIYESVVKGLNPDPPGTPESFKVLVRELQTLGLHVSLDKDEE
ncbi:MAG: DNA-directed RNA polymerase subunit beta [Candidatus Poribacteria bacterium]|nr:DNA-directed RNA polymerase subunit beta [Candidatus Poribacteria bacterium]